MKLSSKIFYRQLNKFQLRGHKNDRKGFQYQKRKRLSAKTSGFCLDARKRTTRTKIKTKTNETIVYSIASKKNIWTWFIRCTLCVREFFPHKIWWLRIAKNLHFFANFKMEFIFANDGNVDTSRELIFANWSIFGFLRKKFLQNWPKLTKFAKINSHEN